MILAPAHCPYPPRCSVENQTIVRFDVERCQLLFSTLTNVEAKSAVISSQDQDQQPTRWWENLALLSVSCRCSLTFLFQSAQNHFPLCAVQCCPPHLWELLWSRLWSHRIHKIVALELIWLRRIARSLPGILFMTNILEPLKILFILEPLERLFCSTKSLSVGWKLECKPKVKCPYKFITRNSAAFGHAFPCARRPK